MYKVTFRPSGKSVQVPAGTSLLDAAREAQIEFDAPCGGEGTCGGCSVKIVSGSVDSESLGVLSEEDVARGLVMACKTKILEEDIVVEVPEQSSKAGGKFAESYDEGISIRSELLAAGPKVDPLTIKTFLCVPQPKPDEGLSDMDRLTRAIQEKHKKKPVMYPLSVIKKIADALREREGQVTATVIRDGGGYHVIEIEPGKHDDRHYGIAVDLGTTTIAVMLVSLPSAEIIEIRTDYNAQIECGLDIISRINYARTPERLEELRLRALKTINQLIEQVRKNREVKAEEISSAVISGNPTMIHLLLGLKSEYLRIEPYVPTVLEVPYLKAGEVGIAIHPNSWIYFSPAVGSYVGGDITAGLLCTDLAKDVEEVNLFIDIGTNGEIVLGNKEFLMGCACSAGPAFEGSGIKCGMRAAAGAIERVTVDPKTGISSYSTIGGGKPRGICGTGMISLMAELFRTGYMDAGGKLNRSKSCKAIQVKDRFTKYVIAGPEQSHSGKPIEVWEADIENIIRAKAAIFSACSLMIEMAGMSFNDLSRIYIGGGFGRFLDIEQARIIGLIPDLNRSKFQYIGNSSLLGSYMLLISRKYAEKQFELSRRMTYIDLSSVRGYMDHYTGALFLPHTNPDLFASVFKKTLSAAV